MDLFAAHNYAKSHWRLIGPVAVAITVVVAVLLFMRPDQYTATVMILPQEDQLASGGIGDLAGMASSFGINLRSGSAGYEQYPAIIKSRRILGHFANEGVKLLDGRQISLADLLKVPQRNAAIRSEMTFDHLAHQAVAITLDRKTRVLQLNVTLPDPDVSAALANELASSLDTFNRQQFTENAGEQRRFIEGRLVEVGSALGEAESLLESFRVANQMTRASAPLQLQESRLMRNVNLQTALYTELRRQLEIERIDEQRNTNTLRILEDALPPALPSGPRRIRLIALAFVLSLGASYLTAFAYGLRRQGCPTDSGIQG